MFQGERVGGMERVLIIGALTFVGYHLVNKMIAEEVEVYGLDFDEFDSMTKINEEKLLLIGRNALFTYYSIRDEDGWRSIEEEKFDAVYFCLYEPNQQSGFRNERVILQYLKRIIRLCEEHKVKLNLISSIEVGNAAESENKRLFAKVEEGLKKGEVQYSVFRVPTLYGPWQPSFMMYHQLILSELGEKECDYASEENGIDLLYVEDVCEYLWENGMNEERLGIYNLLSGKKSLWKKGMNLLHAEDKVNKENAEGRERAAEDISIKRNTPLEYGLNKQLAHMKKYKELYEG
ncbi:NAD(P)-dependent oxidoreductase [Bacillus cereus]|uniref:NAD-dependent epimerase/dehydratase family protein n=1 Tax=Bacillus TaxID=1386 RepID=UPI0008FDEAA4|nr:MULTISPECIES: NAD(P)-dependent oxidoreductase [Bacillus]AXO91982.1 NAD(P)-dependent oxidoreductase [Bacillus anthracis]MBE3641122.1 NAD(P)-dependent oxidoreductase [Bacillus anthracis]MCX9099619.1 NAD(P)-dependent oxidoreductase [Bacillus anthracis]MDA1738525.1 NAD(P)-dependent oxidoreductase [Bacillus cereus]MDA1755811.1 NAD(P)-dependent oxidoreductase [Bacillus cereus]